MRFEVLACRVAVFRVVAPWGLVDYTSVLERELLTPASVRKFMHTDNYAVDSVKSGARGGALVDALYFDSRLCHSNFSGT